MSLYLQGEICDFTMQRRDHANLKPVINISLSNGRAARCSVFSLVTSRWYTRATPTIFSCQKVYPESIQGLRCNFQFTENLGDREQVKHHQKEAIPKPKSKTSIGHWS